MVQTTVRITDNASAALNNIALAATAAANAYNALNQQLGVDVDSSTLDSLNSKVKSSVSDYNSAKEAAQGYKEAVESIGAISTPSPNVSNIQKTASSIKQTLTSAVTTAKATIPTPIITSVSSVAKRIRQILSSAFSSVRGVIPTPITTGVSSATTKIKSLIMKTIGSAKGSIPAPDTSKAESAISSLKNSITGLFAVVGGTQLASAIVGQSDEYTNTVARLNMMNDGLQTTEELQAKIYSSAQDARGAYTDTAAAISQMGILAGDAFSSNDELIAFMNQVNKQFAIAGTSAEGQAAAMLQLTQAMGSGVLRGEELNSVFEQAPTIIQAIANQLGVSTGEIRNMASEGKITAEVVKSSLLAAADETNAKFATMPMTFAQVWTSFKNQASQALQPVYDKLSALFNTAEFQSAMSTMASMVGVIANVVVSAMDKIATVINFVKQNFDVIAPIVAGVTAAFITYKVVVTVATAAMTAFAAAQAIALTPLTVILALIALIPAAIALAVAAFNHFSGSSISALGIIAGGLNALKAIAINVATAIMNGFSKAAELIANVFNNPVEAAIAVLGTLVSGALKAVSGVASAIDSLVNTVVGGLESIINAGINAINSMLSAVSTIPLVGDTFAGAQLSNVSLGTSNISGSLSNLADSVYSNMTSDWKNAYKSTATTRDYTSVTDAYKTGYDTGSNFSISGLSSLTSSASSTATDTSWQNALANATNTATTGTGTGTSGTTSTTGTSGTSSDDSKTLSSIDKTTSAIESSTSGSDEQIKWLKIIAERISNSKVSPSKINIKIDGKTVKESSESALTTKLTDALTQYLATHTESAFM